jgi:hypothetical protein
MRTLRRFFLGRLLREKLMLVAFVALGVAMWLSAFSGRANRAWQAHSGLSSDLAEQSQWLANREAIETGAVNAVQNLDPARTFDDTRLVGELSALGKEHNLRYTIDTPQTARSGQFAMHTVQINLTRSDWDTLRRFYMALSRRSPYVGIEQFALSADRANPAQLNAQLRVSSVEIVR